MKTWAHYAFVVGNEIREVCSSSGVCGVGSVRVYAKEVFGDDCKVFDVSNLRVSIFDTYHDDAFWRVNDDGTETKIEETPSEEDRIEAVESTSASNTSSIESNTTAIDDILVMLLDDGSTETDTTEATE